MLGRDAKAMQSREVGNVARSGGEKRFGCKPQAVGGNVAKTGLWRNTAPVNTLDDFVALGSEAFVAKFLRQFANRRLRIIAARFDPSHERRTRGRRVRIGPLCDSASQHVQDRVLRRRRGGYASTADRGSQRAFQKAAGERRGRTDTARRVDTRNW